MREGAGEEEEEIEEGRRLKESSAGYYGLGAVKGMLSAGSTYLAITLLDVLKVNMQVSLTYFCTRSYSCSHVLNLLSYIAILCYAPQLTPECFGYFTLSDCQTTKFLFLKKKSSINMYRRGGILGCCLCLWFLH